MQAHSARVVSIDSGGHRARVLGRRDDLVREHLALIDQIARNVHSRLPPSFLLKDLIQTGRLALTAAATTYRPDQHGGTPFSAYARKPIRGAILESVRRRNFTEETLAERRDPAQMPEQAELATPELAIDSARLKRRMLGAAARLPHQQRTVLAHYYSTGEPTLDEVGRRMGLSGSRARQIHAEAVDGLRRLLREAV